MSILSHKQFDSEHYQVPDHVRPSDAARQKNTTFDITDVRYFKQEKLRDDSSDYMHGEMWLNTNYFYDGKPVSVWLDIGRDGIIASELYLDLEEESFGSTNADKYGKSSFPNLEDYVHNKPEFSGFDKLPLTNKNGETVMASELMGLAREYGMQNVNKPHVMSYDEYKDFRDINVSRMGEYQDYDYSEYIGSVVEDMTSNRTEYIGKYTTPDQAEMLSEYDPKVIEDYSEWHDTYFSDDYGD